MIEQERHISNLPLRFGTSWIHHDVLLHPWCTVNTCIRRPKMKIEKKSNMSDYLPAELGAIEVRGGRLLSQKTSSLERHPSVSYDRNGGD